MKFTFKNIALIISISLNAAVLSGYLYGLSAPHSVESSVPPGLRDPNLTPAQIQSIQTIRSTRDAWLREYSNRYRDEMLRVIDLLEAPDPDWNLIETRQSNLLKIRSEYQHVQVRGWFDIHRALTSQQGHQYLDALRGIVRSLDYGHAATVAAGRR